MTEQLGTQDIYKFIMAAPSDKPLTLSPVDLMLLREWLRNDAEALRQFEYAIESWKKEEIMVQDEMAELRAERDELRGAMAAAVISVERNDLHVMLIKTNAKLKTVRAQHELAISVHNTLDEKITELEAELRDHETFQHLDDDRLAKENERLHLELAGLRNEYVEVVDELAQYKQNIKTMRVLSENCEEELAAIKPSWDDAPEWAEWLAMDESGVDVWYKNKPTVDVVMWEAEDEDYQLADDYPNWRKTLERRPEVES